MGTTWLVATLAVAIVWLTIVVAVVGLIVAVVVVVVVVVVVIWAAWVLGLRRSHVHLNVVDWVDVRRCAWVVGEVGFLVVDVDVGFKVGMPDAFEILPNGRSVSCGVGVVAVRVHKERTIVPIMSCHSARVTYVCCSANAFVVGTTFGNGLV